MDKIKNKELRKYIALVNYIFVLILILMNLDKLVSFGMRILKIFRPVMIAIVLAFIINIPMTFIESKIKTVIKPENKLSKYTRLISYLLATAFVLFIFIIVINLVVPELIVSIKTLIQNISERSQIIDIKGILSFIGIDGIEGIDINQILENSGLTVKSLTDRLSNILSVITGGVLVVVSSAGGTLIDWMMGGFISIYFLLKKEETLTRCSDFLYAVLPINIRRVIFQYLKTYYRIFDMFVGRRLLESAILGIIEYIGCIICGFPYAALIAVMTCVLSIIPYFGCLVAVIVGFVLIIPVSLAKAILFVIVFEIITIFESNVIYPRVVGKTLGLPEAWTLVGLILFGALWGFAGMLVAVPITACFYISLTDFVSYRKARVDEIKHNEEVQLDKEIERIKHHKISDHNHLK